jgi:hypothetical protein
MEVLVKFAIAINSHGVTYYLNAQHIRLMTVRGKGADRTTQIELTDDRSIDVYTDPESIMRQAQAESFIEVNAAGSGIRLLNIAQILSVDPADEGSVITFISGDKLSVDESYEQLADLLAVDIP